MMHPGPATLQLWLFHTARERDPDRYRECPNMLYRNVHTGPKQGKEPGSIVYYVRVQFPVPGRHGDVFVSPMKTHIKRTLKYKNGKKGVLHKSDVQITLSITSMLSSALLTCDLSMSNKETR